MDDWLSKRLSDIIMDSYYKFSIRQGDMLISTSSPPLHLGTACGLNFILGSNQLSLRYRRTAYFIISDK